MGGRLRTWGWLWICGEVSTSDTDLSGQTKDHRSPVRWRAEMRAKRGRVRKAVEDRGALERARMRQIDTPLGKTRWRA
jgi:hypothetical protein